MHGDNALADSDRPIVFMHGDALADSDRPVVLGTRKADQRVRPNKRCLPCTSLRPFVGSSHRRLLTTLSGHKVKRMMN